MFQSFDSLNQEIINVQLLDLYFKNGEIRTETAFFTEDYIYQMKKMENLLKSYEESGRLDSQEQEIEDDIEYTLDDVLELLVADLDLYSLIYNIPEIKIENIEWDLFFITIANYYQKQKFSYFFMDDMVALNRMVLAKAMVYEDESIDLKTYISSLKYIESDILTISNIKEIAERIGEVFGMNALELLVNKDGSYGCIGKESKLLILDAEEEETTQLGIEQLKKHLQQNGYKINETLEIQTSGIRNEKDNQKQLSDKVIDFQTYKTKIRK